jgi:hypothetical protein
VRIPACAGSRTTSSDSPSFAVIVPAPQDSAGGSGKSCVWLGEVFEHKAQNNMIEVPLGKGKFEQVCLLGLDIRCPRASTRRRACSNEAGETSTDTMCERSRGHRRLGIKV